MTTITVRTALLPVCLLLGVVQLACGDGAVKLGDDAAGNSDAAATLDGGAPADATSIIDAPLPDSRFLLDANYAGALDLASTKQLFLDGYLIEADENLSRSLHQAVKTSPVLEPEHPWEGVGTNYSATWFPGTVLLEDGVFKMWYQAMRGDAAGGVANYGCFATSTDGVNWTKPSLGLVSYGGSTDNNIVKGGSLAVTIDGQADAAHRYKLYGGYDGGHGGFYSADGLSWNRLGFHIDLGDVGTMSFDPIKREYLIAIKGNQRDANGFNTRKQYNVTSTDLIAYSEVSRMDGIADATDAQGYVKAASYGMGVYPYEGVYLGFNWLFLITSQTVGVGEDGVIEVDLLFKRGDFRSQWQRPSRTPIIPRGPNGSWDDGMITTATHPIIVGEEMWLYYSGWDGDHVTPSRTAKIAIAKWRLDGFMSLDAGAAEGWFSTPLVHFTGDSLLVNANAAGGELRVEVLNRDGDVISGYAKADCDVIQSDDVEHVVSWQGRSDISELIGQVVQVKVYMTNTELYALKFGSPEFQ